MAVLGGIVSAHAPTKLWIKIVYIAAFILLGAVGGYFIVKQSRETAEAQREAQLAQTKLSNSIENLGKTAEESRRVARLNTELQERVLSEDATIAKIATTAVNSVTGGNSFCYLAMVRNFPGVFLAEHHGDYPIYDVKARALDLIAFDRLSREQQQATALRGDNIVVGDLAPGSSKTVNFPFPLPETDEANYNLFFNSSRNGFWIEHMKLRRIGDLWYSAIEVVKPVPGHKDVRLMEPLVDKGFPKPVEWSK